MRKEDPFRSMFIGEPATQFPSRGPWTFKRATAPDYRGGRYEVWTVLDADGKCVAECDKQIDAIHIAQNGPKS